MIVFVTGATAGFGLAIARRFAADGARVVAAGRRRDRLEALVGELGADRAHALPLDVADRGAVSAAVAGLPDGFAAVDVLVNNAGLARGLEPAQSAALDDWDAMVDTNIKGLMYVTRARAARDGGAEQRARGEHRLHRRASGPIRAATSTAPPRPSSASSASTSAPTCGAPRCG